ncbi:hypothetical protein GCM10028807_09830 [Spirosoma daeguense]
MTLVSDNIRYLRKLNGLTQEQFSRKINIKRSLLGAYEEGRANPNQQNMQAIAKAFNTTVELLTRQDLRKLRETPSLSIPLGQKTADTYPTRHDRHVIESGPAIRSDGKFTSDDDPFQHPDFPDIFAQPSQSTPEPQPLSSVLNKYYRPQDEVRRGNDHPTPTPPVITSPVRPVQDRPVATTSVPPNTVKPADWHRQDKPDPETLFSPPADRWAGGGPATPNPSRPNNVLTFNNVYQEPGVSTPSAPVNSTLGPSIPIVMQAHFATYRQHYQQADFLYQLPAMHLPNLPEGHYRAFEAGDDFSFPGALLVGKFIRNWFDIIDGKMYVLMLNQPGGAMICCRRVYNQVKIRGVLLLTADRADIGNREVPLKDVLEVWEVSAFVSQEMPPLPPSTDRLRQLIEELKFEADRL